MRRQIRMVIAGAMSRRIRLVTGGVLGVALAGAVLGAHSTPGVRKGIPLYLLIQGGGLESPVVIHRGPYPGRTGDPAYGADPLYGFINTLTSSERQEPSTEDARYYEIGEFRLNKHVPAPGPDGAPSTPLRMEDALTISRIYPDEPGGAIWNYTGLDGLDLAGLVLNIIYGPDGKIDRVEATAPPHQVESTSRFRRIVPRGMKMLEGYGLVFAVGG